MRRKHTESSSMRDGIARMASRRTAARSVTTAVAAVVEGLERRRLLSTVGPNVNISRSTGYEAETTIAIDPTNPNRMFAASNISGAGMRAAYSLDAGATWTSRTMASGADGLPVACCDPQSPVDRIGNLFRGSRIDPVHPVLIAVSPSVGTSLYMSATHSIS